MSVLAEILPELKTWPALVVTGPQRSGTTIAARILARETGYRYVDEDEFGIHDGQKAQAIIACGGVVLQAPGLSYIAHELRGCAVVFVRRNLSEIHASEQRIGWGNGDDWYSRAVEMVKYGTFDPDVAKVKYQAWDAAQKGKCAGFDLEYDGLKEHPLFMEKEKRANFTARQWS